MRTLLKNAKILKMIDENIIEGHVAITDNMISEVGPDVDINAQYDKVIDCEGNLLMPGFKNAHTHSAMTFLRSKADDSSLQDWLFKEIFPREANLHPGCIKELTKVAILEYLTSGITSCLDMYFFIDEYKEACDELGFRSVFIGMYNPKDGRDVDSLIRMYKEWNQDKNALNKMVIGMHAEYTADEEQFMAMENCLKTSGSPFYVHACETYSEVKECIDKRGMTPIEYFDLRHLFDNGGAIFHGVYLTDNDMKILKEKDITVVSCPASNMKLASGIADITCMLNKGLRIAIGTDGSASNNALDMFREMYLLTGLQKIATKNPVSISAFEVLKMATVNGAIAMNLDNAKYLEVGQLADIIMIDLMRPSMQPINNIISNLVYSGGKDVVKMTMINGKILYFDGKFLINEDISEIYKKAQSLTDELGIIKQ
ncbi:MAG: amidohydrolase [Bacilli bacterium]|nr:amidohydrolase [Bacilli bacterium]